MGQSNDTYWHGLFGGLYLNDLRVRAHGHLITRAEHRRARHLRRPGLAQARHHRLRLQLEHELLIEGNALNLYIDLAEGGSIFEWDLRPHNYNLVSTVSRRPEPYHERLRKAEEEPANGGEQVSGRKTSNERRQTTGYQQPAASSP